MQRLIFYFDRCKKYKVFYTFFFFTVFKDFRQITFSHLRRLKVPMHGKKLILNESRTTKLLCINMNYVSKSNQLNIFSFLTSLRLIFLDHSYFSNILAIMVVFYLLRNFALSILYFAESKFLNVLIKSCTKSTITKKIANN